MAKTIKLLIKIVTIAKKKTNKINNEYYYSIEILK